MHQAEKKKSDGARRTRRSSFLLSLISLCMVASLLTCATLAWISLNKELNGGMGMSVEYDRFFVEHACYKYNPKEEIVEKYDSLIDIDFNQYDLVFRARNRYTPIVATIKMTGEDLDKTGGTINILIRRDDSIDATLTDENGDHLSKIFSNIMRVTAFIDSEYYSANNKTLFQNVDTTANYNSVRALTGETDNSKLFTITSISNNQLGDVTKKDVTISIDYDQDDFNVIDGVQTLIVYLYFTYDEGYQNSNYNGLLGIYQKTSEALSVSSTGDITETSLKFVNDLLSIKVSHS